MFSIKLIIYLNLLSNTIAQQIQKHSKIINNSNLIIDPLELALRSSGAEGSFYCTSKVEIDKQQSKLIVSIDKTNSILPTFQLKTEQINSTTIRIRIIPNGSIGINRIRCHWNSNITNGQTANLTIGETPGVIRLIERCRAYDRRYVECTFHAPIISQAFRNGFPQTYAFSELNHGIQLYHHPPILINITNQNELVFRFEPLNQNTIPEKIRMLLNITLSRFGSSDYRFNVEPIHTTKLDFGIKQVSDKQLDIYINHNNTNTIKERLCSGHVTHIDNQSTLTTVQDITETSKQKISINHLRSSAIYLICLRCYYLRTDQSFREEKCITNKTASEKFSTWKIILLTCTLVLILSCVGYLIVRYIKNRNKSKPPPNDPAGTELLSINTNQPRSSPTYSSSSSSSSSSSQTNDNENYPRYLPRKDIIQQIINRKKVSPDTYDLTND